MNIRFKISKHKIQHSAALLAAVTMLLAGCTKNFEKDNTNPYNVPDASFPSALPTAIGPIEQQIFHNYQTGMNLAEDSYCGYLMSPSIGNFSGGNNNLNYSFVDGWVQNAFQDTYTYIMAPFKRVRDAGVPQTAPEIWGVALLIQADAMARVTDRFGSIPYSKAGTAFSGIAYDSQQDIYNLFFKQIDTAIANIRAYEAKYPNQTPGQSSLGSYDLVYGGDYKQWVKFANSLRLRLAMRIVKADPVTAQQQAEKAMADNGGLLSAASDAAYVQQSANRQNDYNMVCGWGDTRANAAIITYMNGYSDPRLPAYFLQGTSDASVSGQYIGIRIGAVVNDRTLYTDYSNMNVDAAFAYSSPQLIMSAAEIWFLKAEAALRGWAGAGDAQTNYETGIQISMNEWNVSIGNYLSNATGKETNYVDPNNAANSAPALSAITVQWDNNATNEQKLERIITQKWIAMFPDGADAWADYRRTGYPKLFPVVVNKSGGTISDSIQVRRLPYPQEQYRDNNAAVTAAVQSLGGADNGGARVWWDVAGKGNF